MESLCLQQVVSIHVVLFFLTRCQEVLSVTSLNIVGNSERIYMELVNLSIHLFNMCPYLYMYTYMYLYIDLIYDTFHSFHNNPIRFQRFKRKSSQSHQFPSLVTPLSGLEHPCWGFSAWFVPMLAKPRWWIRIRWLGFTGGAFGNPVFWRWKGRCTVCLFFVCVCSLK